MWVVESPSFKQLRLRPENTDSDSYSDSVSTPTYQEVFNPKESNKMRPLLYFPFDCITTGDAVIRHRFALTADTAGVDIADSFECGKV